MRVKKSILLLTTVFLFAFFYANGQKDLTTTSYRDLQKEQMKIVSSLTGVAKIDKKSTLKCRWDEEERALTRAYLIRSMKRVGLKPEQHSYELINEEDITKPYQGINLYAIIPASIPSQEYLVIGAHYDTVEGSPGASDNASGVALIYGVAKLATALNERKKNLIVVFFDQEELGCIGSKAFVQLLQKRNWNIHSVHTVDQIGWDNDGDRHIELELPTPYLTSVYEKHAQKLGITVYITTVTGSDHREFRAAGYQAVGITEEYTHHDTSPYLHMPDDTFDTVDFDYLTFSTLLVSSVIEYLIMQT